MSERSLETLSMIRSTIFCDAFQCAVDEIESVPKEPSEHASNPAPKMSSVSMPRMRVKLIARLPLWEVSRWDSADTRCRLAETKFKAEPPVFKNLPEFSSSGPSLFHSRRVLYTLSSRETHEWLNLQLVYSRAIDLVRPQGI